MKLNIATCQFSVDRDIRRNYRSIVRQIQAAKKQGAHVVHFPELALSGYAGVEFDSYKDFDWSACVASSTRQDDSECGSSLEQRTA